MRNSRVVLPIAAIVLSGCATEGKPPQVLSSTQAGIELALWCPDALDGDDRQCRQKAADMAQMYCLHNGRHAQYLRSEQMVDQNARVLFAFNCVR